MKDKTLHLFLINSILIILIWSGINPFDKFTWILEVLPAIIGGFVLIIIYSKFKFTNLVYILIWVHALILIVGGHYTYAQMPLFNVLRDIFNLNRNYYDRLGHFSQGFIPSIIAREILIRNNIVTKKKWLEFIIVCICLAISASYELIEFAVAKFTGTSAEAFLGTQGDIWDTQWDMLFALIGSIVAILTLSKYHNKQLSKK
ncbi:DUF2238 domain-containing protein [Clostridium tetani]|uniref:DUF2238 domain-containing protein n=1 Tax=Clostridium tetani TaxID=1513 RepID=UPI00100B2AEF|nr:DUF2238 domain-containing protein [Clostridium tetani]RXI46827.1 DUF2238 domain-containing protein [Clostridium tetani]RXM60731.1 DUF2238 domain-containing protein [Clostridium tetani]RXM68461.1 DUF2238 domain-containing protein [Clostridium tetani]